MNEVVIVPTGDEIKAGTVTDTNSPAIMEIVLEKYPQAAVLRVPPVNDVSQAISQEITAHSNSDLIIIIGGSGGGKKFDPALSTDVTHLVLENVLDNAKIKEIYGYNGHLWTRLVIGKLGKALVANVPGPMVEAVAAARALLEGLEKELNLEELSINMAEAVFAKYPLGGNIV